MNAKVLSLITLAILLLSLHFYIPNVFAYVSTPIQSGNFPTAAPVANYATMTRYDAAGGDTNNPYFFPGIESHSTGGDEFIYHLKITVTGIKPNGEPISGLEFCDLAWLDSPHDQGSSWYNVLTALYYAISDLVPYGASELLKHGLQSPESGVGWDATSAWAEWWWDGSIFTRTINKGLQFRFALHCDPDLHGFYTLSIQYYVQTIWESGSGSYTPDYEQYVYDTVTYYFGSPTLSISASFGGTTNPAPETYTHGYGTPVTVTAIAFTHYVFDYWLLDGVECGSDPTITVTMDADHNLIANFKWVNNQPYTPSTPSGPTSGYRNVWYTYSTSTTDPDGDDIQYEFEFTGPIPTVSFTTGWYASGQTGSVTVMWETTDPLGTYYVRVRAQDVYGAWSGWSSSLQVIITGGGGCPTLFVWDGIDYIEEGVLDIHAESDITVQHEIQNTLALENGVYNLQLRELDEFTSHIDQVKLYAVDYQGEWHLCPLTYAYHNEFGKVTWRLFFDDEKRVDLTPTQTIDLKFLPSIAYKQTAYFIFEINGYNQKPHPL